MNINQTIGNKDTLMLYDIWNISTEGAESKVNYINGKISKSLTNVYGETGQAIIVYKFERGRIKVIETLYSYKTIFYNVKSNKELKLDKEQSYYIDYNGKIIGKPIKDRIDIFQEFKNVVPFELN